jgi:hypothetical protein
MSKQTYRENKVQTYREHVRVNDPFLGALRPSKSGLMNKHIVKHVSCLVSCALYPSKSGLIHRHSDDSVKHSVKHTMNAVTQ